MLPTTLASRSPHFYLLFNKNTAIAPRSPSQQYSLASQTQTTNMKEENSLRSNQLGSPASLKQLGFFINKGALHIREFISLSFLKEVVFTLFTVTLCTSTILEAVSPLISALLAALHKHPKRLSLFLSPSPFQGERRAFNESPAAPAVFWSVSSPSSSSVSDGSDREDTCPEPPLTERESRKERSGGREAHCLMGETHNEATNLQRLSLIVTGQEVPCY